MAWRMLKTAWRMLKMERFSVLKVKKDHAARRGL